jgi:hypothetical protein
MLEFLLAAEAFHADSTPKAASANETDYSTPNPAPEASPFRAGYFILNRQSFLSKIPLSAETSCLAKLHCVSQADQFETATRKFETQVCAYHCATSRAHYR